jgi:hypothetical protein
MKQKTSQNEGIFQSKSQKIIENEEKTLKSLFTITKFLAKPQRSMLKYGIILARTLRSLLAIEK